MLLTHLTSILDTEYDHLDYARPSASFKPHYHRMTGEMSSPSKESNKLDEEQPALAKHLNQLHNLNIALPPPLPLKSHSPTASSSSASSSASTITQDDNIDKFNVEKPINKNMDDKNEV